MPDRHTQAQICGSAGHRLAGASTQQIGAIIMNVRCILAAVLSVGLAGAVTSPAMAGEKKDQQDVKIPMDQVPAAVKATITKEAKGGKIGDIDKETEKGKTVYSADVTIDGKAFEVKVAEDGTLISNKADDDKKEEKGEKGEH
jgi:hypothetical protein